MTGSISVVMPCYNGEAHLREALDSVLAQTLAADEIVVVDDASKDGSVEIVESYGDRVKLLPSPNATGTGHGAAANRGIMASRGDYIAFLHTDDVWLPEHLEKLSGLLEKWPEAGVALSRFEFIGSRTGAWLDDDVLDWDAPRDVFELMLRNTIVVPSVSMIRREVAAQVGGFDEGRPFLADDLDFFARCAMSHKFMACPDITARYRWHEGQCSTNMHGTLINAARYRAKIAKDVQCLAEHQARSSRVRDRIQMSWVEELEKAWSARELNSLSHMVRYGLCEPLYREKTKPYVLKSRLPSWLVQAIDRRRGAGSRL